MAKKYLSDRIIFLFSIVFLIAVMASLFNSGKSEVCFEKECLEVELAVTDEEQVAGLSGRKELEESKGMLFIMEKEGIHSFWMKDMLFSLDMVWISSNGTVVDFIENAELCNGPICMPIIPHAESKYVLEVNAGAINNLELDIGKEVDIRIRN